MYSNISGKKHWMKNLVQACADGILAKGAKDARKPRLLRTGACAIF
jgi:hypothetical protein